MTYNKPEVAVLGDARSVIESLNNKHTDANDPVSPTPNNIAAYDLDE
jgi:hypothetical protein